jgi:hypothetical protein
MTFPKRVMTASILSSRVRFHRVRAERFGARASRSQNRESRAMYAQLAAKETALAERLERQPRKRSKIKVATPGTPEKPTPP